MQEVYQGVPVEGEGRNRTGWREELCWRQSQGRTQLTLNGRLKLGCPSELAQVRARRLDSTITCHWMWTSWEGSVNWGKVALLS